MVTSGSVSTVAGRSCGTPVDGVGSVAVMSWCVSIALDAMGTFALVVSCVGGAIGWATDTRTTLDFASLPAPTAVLRERTRQLHPSPRARHLQRDNCGRLERFGLCRRLRHVCPVSAAALHHHERGFYFCSHCARNCGAALNKPRHFAALLGLAGGFIECVRPPCCRV